MRVYGKWAGNPNGYPENKDKCIVEIWHDFVSCQCSRKRGHGPDGLYCKQHAKMLEKGISLFTGTEVGGDEK